MRSSTRDVDEDHPQSPLNQPGGGRLYGVTHPVATRAAHLRINWIADHPTWWPWARWFRRIRISCRHPPSRSLVTSWERHSPNDANSQGLVGTLGPE
jgi:hypothetical protein